MLKLKIPPQQYTLEKPNGEVVFGNFKGGVLQLEHSLISLSKWESLYKKPFLSSTNKTMKESIDYIKCMTINNNVDPMIYMFIRDEHISEINKYIEDPHTATFFAEDGMKTGRNRIITSELIYYWMIALNIPVKFETWHIHRLLALIRVCEIESTPKKKRGGKRMSPDERHRINMARRAARHSTG